MSASGAGSSSAYAGDENKALYIPSFPKYNPNSPAYNPRPGNSDYSAAGNEVRAPVYDPTRSATSKLHSSGSPSAVNSSVLASVEMSSPEIKHENPSPAFDPTANKSPQ